MRRKFFWFLTGFMTGFSICTLLAVLILTSPKMYDAAKYRLKGTLWNPAVSVPYGATEVVNRIECIGSEKDCGKVHSIPEPGTLFLVGIGFAIIIVTLNSRKN